MSRTELPTIGFDRYIEYEWLEYSLQLAYAGDFVNTLKLWLNQRIEGKVSARKTANVLTNIWLRRYEQTAQVRDKAIILYPNLIGDERLILHWGMALANFSLFRNVVGIMGRLIRLQGGFRKGEIHQRLLEIYSNQGTIPRSVNRIIQSIKEWNVITLNQDNIYLPAKSLKIDDFDLLAWLFEAAIIDNPDKHWALQDVLRLPELFPFDVAQSGSQAIRDSSNFSVIREGMNLEFISLRAPGE